MKLLLKTLFVFVIFFMSISFTSIFQNDMKIIRYKKLNDGYLVIEYIDGKIKKQVKNRQIMVYQLPSDEKMLIEQEINKIDVNNVIKELDAFNNPIVGTAYMYLFIKKNDTLKTKFYPEGNTPKQLQRLDYLLNKNRK